MEVFTVNNSLEMKIIETKINTQLENANKGLSFEEIITSVYGLEYEKITPEQNTLFRNVIEQLIYLGEVLVDDQLNHWHVLRKDMIKDFNITDSLGKSFAIGREIFFEDLKKQRLQD